MRDLLARGRRREFLGTRGQPTLVDFECHSLCTTCGYLTEPRPDSVEPIACPACRSPGMLDLRNDAMVEQLADLEAREAPPRRLIVRVLQWVSALVALGGVIFMGLQIVRTTTGELGSGFHDRYDDLLVLMLPVVVMAGAVLVDRLSTRVRTARSTPRRWRLAGLPEALGSLRGEVTGEASSSVELLRAPLSGRPCIAWEIAVGGLASDDRLASWRLVEQHNVACRVGELEIGEDQLVLQLPRESWLSDTPVRFLRMRGLLDREQVEIFETILAPGQVCRVGRSSKGRLHAYA